MVKDKLIQLLNKSSFLKNSLTLMSGTIIAQIFSFATLPILTSIYNPGEFGLFGLFSAILIIVAVLTNGGYESAIMLPKTNIEAQYLLFLCGIINISISMISLMIISFFNYYLSHLIEDKSILNWLYLLPFSVFLEGLYISLSTFLNRHKDYKNLTQAKILQAFSSGVISIVIGYFFKSILGGLIIGFVFGQLISCISLLINSIKYIDFSKNNFQEIKNQAITYKDFPRFSIGANYLNTVSRQLPFFLIPYFYIDKNILGYFTLTSKILLAPITLISNTISQIFYEKAARAKEMGGNHLREITLKLAKNLSLLGIFPMIIIMIWGKELFSIAFGIKYEMAGQYARWLIPWFTMMCIINPLSYLADIQRRLKFQLNFNLILFITRTLILTFGGIYLNAEKTIALFGITGFITSSILTIWLIKISKNNSLIKNEY
jgi:O-antigen/teichoic acid export membrane protein